MQHIAIISSSKDPAGVNIRNNLIELFDFEKSDEKFDNGVVFQYDKIPNKKIKLYLINDDLIFSENIDKKISADMFIFASKHRSKENTPSFAVHPIGNWGRADFGGEESKLCPSSAVLLKNLFVELNKIENENNFELTMEATHHGPFVEKPAVFCEIGSTDKEWKDKSNGEIMAKTIMNALNNQNRNYKIAVGIGGLHYCNNLNKVVLRTDIAFSHICPKFNLDKLNEELINESIQKTAEKIDFFVLDWKGLGTEKQRIVDLLKSINLETKRTDQIKD
ncbi:MAG: D-aminoacyl-tRNA deacylase [Nanoarchaeota archaeon]|nr:D-aminoacyl-tRNA deacylase [Nanoarchaeota archaeon]